MAADKLQEPVREALKLALDALGNHEGNYKLNDAGCDRLEAAITAIKAALAQPAQEPDALTIAYQSGFYDGKKAALAQPAQEPVARVSGTHGGRFVYDPINRATILPVGMALYSAPPQRQWIWLSDADIAEVVDTTCQYTGGYEEYLIKKAERKSRSMNT